MNRPRGGGPPRPSGRPSASSAPPPRPRSPVRVKRSSTTPSLLRVFVSRTPHHHNEALFNPSQGGPSRSILQDEYQVYVWRDTTLLELIQSLSTTTSLPLTIPSSRYSFNLIYYDPKTSRHLSKPLGSVTNQDLGGGTRPSRDSDKTLDDASWVVGDFVSLVINAGSSALGSQQGRSASSGFAIRGGAGPGPGPGMTRGYGGSRGTGAGSNGGVGIRGTARDDTWAPVPPPRGVDSRDRAPPRRASGGEFDRAGVPPPRNGAGRFGASADHGWGAGRSRAPVEGRWGRNDDAPRAKSPPPHLNRGRDQRELSPVRRKD